MIETLLIYLILSCIAFVVYDTTKRRECDFIIERESDATLEYIGGRLVNKEK